MSFLPLDFGFGLPGGLPTPVNPGNISTGSDFGNWLFGGQPSNVFLPGRDNMADWAAGASGAAGGAATGAAVGGPIGAGVGAGLGFLAGLFGTPTSAGKPKAGLLDGLSLGLGSLGGGGGAPVTVNQSQNVNQETGVNVVNVLGGQPFGGTTASGEFDIFRTIGDVFALRDAINTQQTQSAPAGTSSVPVSKPNLTPILIAGAALVGVLLFTRRK